MIPMPRRGLYAVTDRDLARERGLLASVEQVLRGGAAMVQYRDKSGDTARRRAEASALLARCHRYEVPLIVNDDVALALAIGADGVHVGRDDEAVARARERLGSEAIVGASCYHELGRAERACRDGASYVAFGRFHPSSTKPGRPLATEALLREARSALDVPIVAIGGIGADNGAALVAAGADLLAVIHDLWAAGDCAARARAFARCWDPRA